MQPTDGSGPGSPPSSAVVVANRSNPLTGDELDSVDLATDNLPAVDTPDACDKAALRYVRYFDGSHVPVCDDVCTARANCVDLPKIG